MKYMLIIFYVLMFKSYNVNISLDIKTELYFNNSISMKIVRCIKVN